MVYLRYKAKQKRVFYIIRLEFVYGNDCFFTPRTPFLVSFFSCTIGVAFSELFNLAASRVS